MDAMVQTKIAQIFLNKYFSICCLQIPEVQFPEMQKIFFITFMNYGCFAGKKFQRDPHSTISQVFLAFCTFLQPGKFI